MKRWPGKAGGGVIVEKLPRRKRKPNPLAPARLRMYLEAVTEGKEAASLAFQRGAWSADTERGRLRLIELLASGVAFYAADELNYMGMASDGTVVMLGNPGPNVWSYLAKFPNPEDW